MNKPIEARGTAAWNLLFGIFCLAAGHGIFLCGAFVQSGRPSVRAMGGMANVAVVLYFLACIPLAFLVLVLRRRLLRRGRARLWMATFVAILVTGGAYALYLHRMFTV